MVMRPRGMKKVSGNTFVFTKNFKYNNLVRNRAITINPPTNHTSVLSIKRSGMEKPNNTKKNVLTRKDDSAVNECNKSLTGSSSCEGKYFFKIGNLIFSQLLIINPNTRIISNDGRCKSLPPE